MEENRKKKFVYDETNAPELITNSILQCADCKHKRQRVIECDIYQKKPLYVIERRKPCPDYAAE